MVDQISSRVLYYICNSHTLQHKSASILWRFTDIVQHSDSHVKYNPCLTLNWMCQSLLTVSPKNGIDFVCFYFCFMKKSKKCYKMIVGITKREIEFDFFPLNLRSWTICCPSLLELVLFVMKQETSEFLINVRSFLESVLT